MKSLIPQETYWYKSYIVSPHLTNPNFHQKFRRRFRLPYGTFLKLLQQVTDHPFFSRWHPSKIIMHPKLSPIGLLLLGSLRYLGRGWTFDDLEETTGIDEEVHRVFFHQFIRFGGDVLYPQYVKYPKNSEEAKKHTNEFSIAGLNGGVGSMDACHIIIEKCYHRLKQNHLGGKSKLTCRSFNLTANHRRQILHTTSGHPARWNDKTIVLHDKFACDLRKGKIMQDHIFELLQKDHNGNICAVKYRGAWLLVDNGYLNWGTTIPPMKHTIYQDASRWSEWLESMRKDVECTFGILKGRWRILKSGIRLHGVDVADKIWMTCCALHNLLLEEDGLSVDWSGEIGLFDYDVDSDKLPFAMRRLQNPSLRRNYDCSSMGPGDIDIAGPDNEGEVEGTAVLNTSVQDDVRIDEVNDVHLLTSDFFRGKLIEHFDIQFKQNKIRWPRVS